MGDTYICSQALTPRTCTGKLDNTFVACTARAPHDWRFAAYQQGLAGPEQVQDSACAI